MVRHQQADGGYAVRNSMTGLAYKLSPASFSIYDFVRRQAPVVPAEVVASFAEFPEEDVREIISYFQRHKLIIPGGDASTVALTKKDITLFDLQDTEAPNTLGIVGIPYGQGNSLPNSCSNFPDSYRVHIREKKLSFVKNNIRCNALTKADFGIPEDYNLSGVAHRYIRDLGNIFLNAQYESKRSVYDKIYRAAGQLFRDQITPLFLGGDHSVSYPIIKAAASEYDKVTVIQLDAHTDTYSSPREELQDEEIHHHGNFISRCLQLPNVRKVYQLGIRGEVNFGWDQLSPKQEIIPCSALSRSIWDQSFALDIPTDHKVYLTIDIDVLDPHFAPATATPVPSGLALDELLKCIQLIFDRHGSQIAGCDLVEVSPHRDDDTRTTFSSATYILLQIIQRFSYYAKDN